jgi:hypothetical protein
MVGAIRQERRARAWREAPNRGAVARAALLCRLPDVLRTITNLASTLLVEAEQEVRGDA